MGQDERYISDFALKKFFLRLIRYRVYVICTKMNLEENEIMEIIYNFSQFLDVAFVNPLKE